MNKWGINISSPVDAELLEEAALAMAQSTIQNAITKAGINKAELARKMDRPRSFISLMLSGRHNLTVKTMSRAMTACGFEIRFSCVPIAWSWKTKIPTQPVITPHEEQVPAQAGTPMPVSEQLTGIAVPTLAYQTGVL
jgi:hypothetical protein